MLSRFFIMLLCISFTCNTVIGMESEDTQTEQREQLFQCLSKKFEDLKRELDTYQDQQELKTKKKKSSKLKNQKGQINQLLNDIVDLFNQSRASLPPKICEIFDRLKNHLSASIGKINVPFNRQALLDDLALVVEMIDSCQCAEEPDESESDFNFEFNEQTCEFQVKSDLEKLSYGSAVRGASPAGNVQLSHILLRSESFLELDDQEVCRAKLLVTTLVIGCAALVIYFNF